MLGQRLGDAGEAALDHCLPSTISWPAGEAGKEGKKASNSKPGGRKDLQKRFFFSFPSLPGGVSKKAWLWTILLHHPAAAALPQEGW